MCPQCDRFCNYWRLNSTCEASKVRNTGLKFVERQLLCCDLDTEWINICIDNHPFLRLFRLFQKLCIFDNFGTLVFAVFMSVWGEFHNFYHNVLKIYKTYNNQNPVCLGDISVTCTVNFLALLNALIYSRVYGWSCTLYGEKKCSISVTVSLLRVQWLYSWSFGSVTRQSWNMSGTRWSSWSRRSLHDQSTRPSASTRGKILSLGWITYGHFFLDFFFFLNVLFPVYLTVR